MFAVVADSVENKAAHPINAVVRRLSEFVFIIFGGRYALCKNTVWTIKVTLWFRAKKQEVSHPLFCAPILTISPCGVIVRIGAFVASFA